MVLELTYIPPESSPLLVNSDVDPFDTLATEIIAILGDLNSRTGMRLEKPYGIRPDNSGADITKPVPVVSRSSRDKQVNFHGRKLLRVLSNYGLLIAKGRVCGDLRGSYTCCQYNGVSVVDLLIVQKTLLSKLIYFKVNDFD